MGYLDYAGLQYLWGKLKEKFAPKSHSHDDRYYTEAEMDGKLNSKVNNNEAGANGLINKLSTADGIPNDATVFISQHNDGETASYYRRPISTLWTYIKGKADGVYQPKGSYAVSGHTHDDRYYTESEMNTKLSGKSNTDHTHKNVNDIGTNKPTTFAYSKSGMNYGDYSWLAGWNGYEMRAVNKNQFAITGHTHTKDQVGLGNVDNTADANKSVKYATSAGNASKVNNHTVNIDVPANAKFTDTNTWRGIQNNLTSDSTDQSLSAAQGKALKTLVDGKAPISHTHKKSQITDFPSSMPASDVYAWAKAATKPSYTKAEVGLSNVDNTADKDKSVKYAASAGSATTGLNGVSTCIFDLSSNNGSCVRFYNGLQICFGNSSKSSGVVFKLPFANDNYAVVVGGSDTLKNAWYVAGGRTTTGFNPNQSGFAVLFHWIAIGNWK